MSMRLYSPRKPLERESLLNTQFFLCGQITTYRSSLAALRYIPVRCGSTMCRKSKALFALVVHEESLDIGLPALPINPAGAGGDPLRNVESTAVTDSLERASEAAPAKDPSPTEAALARLEYLVTEAPLWPAAVNIWKRFRTSETPPPVVETGGVSNTGLAEHVSVDRMATEETGDGVASQAGDGVDVTRLKYRFSVVRDGRHPFGSVQASPRLGGAVWSVNPGWTVDLKVT